MREMYFERFPGRYFTGDGARVDEDGYYWLLGRVDDVINVSGHRLGTAEIESALVSHEAVSEAAVVGFPHPVKGEGIHAYVVLRDGHARLGGPRDDPLGSRAQAHRADRQARPHPVRARPAQDALRQDHAPHPAQDRGGRDGHRGRSAISRRWPTRRS